MPEPTIQPIPQPQTATGGFSDPSFMQGLDAAFQQARGAAPPPEDLHADPKPPKADKPVAPVKATEQPTEPEDHEVEPTTSTAKANWKELKRLKVEAEEARTKAETRLKELETRLSRYNDDEITRTKAERDDFEKRLRAFAVEHDPKFQAEYEQGVERLTREATATLGDRAKRFLSLMKLPEGDFKRAQLAELTADLDDFAKQDVYGLMRDHRKLSTERQLQIENARQNYDKIMAMERQRMEDQQRQLMSAFDQRLAEWSGPNGIAALQPREGDEKHNAAVRDAVQRARDIFTGSLTPDEMIRASLWSAAAPNLLRGMETLQTENSELKKQLQSMKASEPDLGDGSGHVDAEPTEDPATQNLSYGDRLAALISRAGAFPQR